MPLRSLHELLQNRKNLIPTSPHAKPQAAPLVRAAWPKGVRYAYTQQRTDGGAGTAIEVSSRTGVGLGVATERSVGTGVYTTGVRCRVCAVMFAGTTASGFGCRAIISASFAAFHLWYLSKYASTVVFSLLMCTDGML